MKGREWEGDDVQKGGMWGDPAVRWWLTDQGKPGSLKTYGYKNLWGLWQWEKLPASQESSLERPQGPRTCTQTHPPGNHQQKGPICLWVAEEVTESPPTAEQVALFPLRPLPNIQCHKPALWVSAPWQIPKVLPLTTLWTG